MGLWRQIVERAISVMSISQLTSYIGQPNIAEDLDDEVLLKIANRVKRQFDEDLESMQDWINQVEKGIDLMRQEWKPKSTPWDGASNYKDPLLTEASVKFGDKAVLELLRGKDLVSSDVIGPDPQMQKKTICERVKEAMNYQINYDIEGWRDSQERLFYCLPNFGTVFKKLSYESIEECCEASLISFPNFVVNQATKSMDDCRSFSHVLDLSRNEVEERIRSGRWLDQEIYGATPDKPEGDEGSNESNSVTNAIDNDDCFVEQQCYFDIDEDDYEEPYIVTMHWRSQKVVRVVARFDEQSIVVKYQDRVMKLPEAKKLESEQRSTMFGGVGMMRLLGMKKEVADAKDDDFELLKIKPFQNVVKYGFIPAPDGTFLDYGYAHLLGAITQALNSSTNQLTDAATLSNVGGALLSKEFRKTPGVTRLKIGENVKTDVPADKLKNGVFVIPRPEPSQTLYTLNKDMLERGYGFLATVDVSGKIQANTPPTTALAIIQEAVIPTTALFMRILRSESKEFQILFRINQRTFPKWKYQQILDDPKADPEQDFNYDFMDICPTANAEMTSKMQRIQTAMIEMEQFPIVLQAGGNPIPIIKNFFDAIGSQLKDQIFPEEGSMSPQEKQQLEQMKQQVELQNQIAMKQLEILSREQDRLDKETEGELRKVSAEVKEINAGIIETLAKARKAAEEAESEAVKNQISVYTAELDGLIARHTAVTNRMKTIGDLNVRASDVANRAAQARISNQRAVL